MKDHIKKFIPGFDRFAPERAAKAIHGLSARLLVNRCEIHFPEFIRLLCSRAIERDKRLEVVDATFRDQAHVFIVNFMKLLVQKERFECFEDCVKWFHQRYNEELGIVEAFVTSAVALSDNDREALRQRLAQISGKKVHLVCDVDPALIGGVRVEMDGRRYDNTIQDRLGRLKRSLTRGL